MPARLIRSLAYRMTLAVIALSLALSLLAAAGLFALQYREVVADVERNLEHVGRTDVRTVSSALWVMDLVQLQTHAEALCSMPRIVRAEIRVRGEVVAASGSVGPGERIDREFPLSFTTGNRTTPLGTLHVRASLDGIPAELFAKTYVRLLFQTAQIFLVAVFMLSLLRSLVTRRLFALETHVRGLNAGRMGVPLILPRPPFFSGPDELDRVSGALNAMAGNLEASFRDIATQKERLAVTLRSIGDGVITTDTHGRVTLMNDVAERLTGWTQQDAAGRSLAEVFAIIDEETRERRENPVQRVLEIGKIVELANHTAIVRRDGSEVMIADTAAPIREREGAIIGVVLVFRDVTEQKRQEAERERLVAETEKSRESLQRQNGLFASLLANLPIGVFMVEAPSGKPLVANDQAFKLLGRGILPDATRENLSEVYAAFKVGSSDPYPQEEMPILLGMSGETSHVDDMEVERPDGTRLQLEIFGSPVRDEQGRVWASLVSFNDISERGRLAEEKARLEDQLRQAQKVEAIGRLAGGVAHDFNNLTAIVLGYGEMLLGQLGPDVPSRKWVEQIVEAGRRSAALTRQLLAFSRKQTLKPEVLDLNALLLNLEKMLGRLIGEDVGLEFKLAAQLARVMADPGQIEQVVTNLVVNARDAMPLGGRLLVETAEVELDEMYAQGHESVIPGRYVQLAVTDTGCGMDKATVERLFEPFFTTKPRGKGTGLGLATVYGIVKQSGGHIWVYSEPGQGTSFKIYLPWTDAEPRAKSVQNEGAASRGSGELILLVEDEAPLRELCETVLTGLGYRVSAAAGGLEALSLVQKQGLEPDLVLTDVIMPGLSGAEMAQRLRENRPGLKVLYMSGYPDDAIARHGVLDAGTHFVQKPFTERVLAAKVREVLGGGVAGTGTETAAEQQDAMTALAARNVLMIDDDEQYRELVRHFCEKRGHTFAGVDSAPAALAVLAGSVYDVLLVDLNIPGTSGESVLREIRAAGNTAPAIILTGDVSAADMNVLRPLGVVQTLEKSGTAEPLLRTIETALRVRRPIS